MSSPTNKSPPAGRGASACGPCRTGHRRCGSAEAAKSCVKKLMYPASGGAVLVVANGRTLEASPRAASTPRITRSSMEGSGSIRPPPSPLFDPTSDMNSSGETPMILALSAANNVKAEPTHDDVVVAAAATPRSARELRPQSGKSGGGPRSPMGTSARGADRGNSEDGKEKQKRKGCNREAAGGEEGEAAKRRRVGEGGKRIAGNDDVMDEEEEEGDGWENHDVLPGETQTVVFWRRPIGTRHRTQNSIGKPMDKVWSRLLDATRPGGLEGRAGKQRGVRPRPHGVRRNPGRRGRPLLEPEWQLPVFLQRTKVGELSGGHLFLNGKLEGTYPRTYPPPPPPPPPPCSSAPDEQPAPPQNKASFRTGAEAMEPGGGDAVAAGDDVFGTMHEVKPEGPAEEAKRWQEVVVGQAFGADGTLGSAGTVIMACPSPRQAGAGRRDKPAVETARREGVSPGGSAGPARPYRLRERKESTSDVVTIVVACPSPRVRIRRGALGVAGTARGGGASLTGTVECGAGPSGLRDRSAIRREREEAIAEKARDGESFGGGEGQGQCRSLPSLGKREESLVDVDGEGGSLTGEAEQQQQEEKRGRRRPTRSQTQSRAGMQESLVVMRWVKIAVPPNGVAARGGTDGRQAQTGADEGDGDDDDDGATLEVRRSIRLVRKASVSPHVKQAKTTAAAKMALMKEKRKPFMARTLMGSHANSLRRVRLVLRRLRRKWRARKGRKGEASARATPSKKELQEKKKQRRRLFAFSKRPRGPLGDLAQGLAAASLAKRQEPTMLTLEGQMRGGGGEGIPAAGDRSIMLGGDPVELDVGGAMVATDLKAKDRTEKTGSARVKVWKSARLRAAEERRRERERESSPEKPPAQRRKRGVPRQSSNGRAGAGLTTKQQQKTAAAAVEDSVVTFWNQAVWVRSYARERPAEDRYRDAAGRSVYATWGRCFDAMPLDGPHEEYMPSEGEAARLASAGYGDGDPWGLENTANGDGGRAGWPLLLSSDSGDDRDRGFGSTGDRTLPSAEGGTLVALPPLEARGEEAMMQLDMEMVAAQSLPPLGAAERDEGVGMVDARAELRGGGVGGGLSAIADKSVSRGALDVCALSVLAPSSGVPCFVPRSSSEMGGGEGPVGKADDVCVRVGQSGDQDVVMSDAFGDDEGVVDAGRWDAGVSAAGELRQEQVAVDGGTEATKGIWAEEEEENYEPVERQGADLCSAELAGGGALVSLVEGPEQGALTKKGGVELLTESGEEGAAMVVSNRAHVALEVGESGVPGTGGVPQDWTDVGGGCAGASNGKVCSPAGGNGNGFTAQPESLLPAVDCPLNTAADFTEQSLLHVKLPADEATAIDFSGSRHISAQHVDFIASQVSPHPMANGQHAPGQKQWKTVNNNFMAVKQYDIVLGHRVQQVGSVDPVVVEGEAVIDLSRAGAECQGCDVTAVDLSGAVMESEDHDVDMVGDVTADDVEATNGTAVVPRGFTEEGGILLPAARREISSECAIDLPNDQGPTALPTTAVKSFPLGGEFVGLVDRDVEAPATIDLVPAVNALKSDDLVPDVNTLEAIDLVPHVKSLEVVGLVPNVEALQAVDPVPDGKALQGPEAPAVEAAVMGC